MISDETVLKAARAGWPQTYAYVQKAVRRALEAALPDIEDPLRDQRDATASVLNAEVERLRAELARMEDLRGAAWARSWGA